MSPSPQRAACSPCPVRSQPSEGRWEPGGEASPDGVCRHPDLGLEPQNCEADGLCCLPATQFVVFCHHSPSGLTWSLTGHRAGVIEWVSLRPDLVSSSGPSVTPDTGWKLSPLQNSLEADGQVTEPQRLVRDTRRVALLVGRWGPRHRPSSSRDITGDWRGPERLWRTPGDTRRGSVLRFGR